MKILRYLLSVALVATVFAAQPKPVQKDPPTNALTEGFNSTKTHTFLTGASVTFDVGSTLTVNGIFSGAPTGGTLNLTNVTVSGIGGSTATSVTNLTALRAVSVAGLTTGTLATVLGHTTANDGGGGTFYFVSAVTYTDDNGLTIAPTVGTGRWFRVWSGPLSVRYFGAVGDGSTDDTTAVQAACDWFDNNPIGTEINANGRLYFPRGRYKVTGITFHNAHGLTVYGDGAYASSIEMNTTSGTMITVDGYISASFTDLSFSNTNGGGNSAGAQTTSIGVYLLPPSGTITTFQRCTFTNWVNCVKVGYTTNGDSGIYNQCVFRRSTNAWYSDNEASSIQTFYQCTYDLITLGAVNTQGVGMIHMDTPNFVGSGSLFYLRPVYATWGASSNYLISNAKMEWTSPSSMWINCQAIDGSEQYPTATFTFNSCSMSGGDGGEVTGTDQIMTLCGAMNVTWNGGNFGGTVKYIKNLQLSQANPNTYNTRVEVIFNGAKYAPLPANIVVYDPSGGASGAAGPVFKWRSCGNLPDLELGGEVGYSYRQRHTVKYQSHLKGAVSISSSARPYDSNFDFFGRVVRIDSIVFVVETGTTPSGTKTAEVFSDAGYTTSLGSVSFTATGTGTFDLPLTRLPTVITDKLYMRYTPPSDTSTFGFWLIDYTVLN